MPERYAPQLGTQPQHVGPQHNSGTILNGFMNAA